MRTLDPMDWRPASNGSGARHWFLVRDESVPVADRFHESADGKLIRYASMDTAQSAADALNAARPRPEAVGFDRALAESRLGTHAELAEQIGHLRGTTKSVDVLLDMAAELAESLEQALDVIEAVVRAVAPSDRPLPNPLSPEPAMPFGPDGVEVRAYTTPSVDHAWIVEHESQDVGFLVKPCPRPQADNAISSVLVDQIQTRDNLNAAIACAVRDHPGIGFAAYIRYDAGEDVYVIAL